MAEGLSTHLLKAMARVYWELWQTTDDEMWRDRWRGINAALAAPVADSA